MSILQTIETDLDNAWHGLEAVVEGDFNLLWGDVKATLTSILPAEWSLFKSFVGKAVAAVESGDFEDIETALLNLAEAAGETFITALESGPLKALLALAMAALGKL